jgi:hypothetical protein
MFLCTALRIGMQNVDAKTEFKSSPSRKSIIPLTAATVTPNQHTAKMKKVVTIHHWMPPQCR